MEYLKRAALLSFYVVTGKAGAVGPVALILQLVSQVLVVSQFSMGWPAILAAAVVLVLTHLAVALILGYVTLLRVMSDNYGGANSKQSSVLQHLKRNAMLGLFVNLMLSSIVFGVISLFTGGRSAFVLLFASVIAGTMIDAVSVAALFALKNNGGRE